MVVSFRKHYGHYLVIGVLKLRRYMLTGLGRKNWRGGFREHYSGNNIYIGIIKPIESAGNK